MPAEAVSMGVSLDGVMVPMKDGDRQGKRNQAKAQGKSPSGPSGYQEVGCGTISFYDRDGERLATRRMGRMPESHKTTLKGQLTAEIMDALIKQPGLKVVKLADGAPDNWTYLGETLPFGDECLDFYHASDHLSGALAAAYGEGTAAYHHRFEKLRAVLRDEAKGPDKIIDALCRLRRRYPRRQVLHKIVSRIDLGGVLSRASPPHAVCASAISKFTDWLRCSRGRLQNAGDSALKTLRDALASGRWTSYFDVAAVMSK